MKGLLKALIRYNTKCFVERRPNMKGRSVERQNGWVTKYGTAVFFVILAAFLTSCSDDPGDAGGGDDAGVNTGADSGPDDAGGDDPTPEERKAADRGGRSSNTSQQLVALADSFFDFDPTIDTTKTAEQNAAAIQANTLTNLSGCGSVTVSGTTVTVSMPPPGCTFENGVSASGTVTLTVTKAGSTITVAMTLTGIVVNGVSLAGTASFVTSNGSTFTVTANLTSDSTTYTCDLTVASTTGSATITGTVTETDGGTKTSCAFTKVIWKQGDCYPNSGSIKITTGLVTTTVSFTASTPTTGQVTVTSGRKTYTTSLPAYGNCPPAKDGG